MDGRTDGRADGRTDKQKDRLKDRQTDEWIDRQTDKAPLDKDTDNNAFIVLCYRWADHQTNRPTDRQKKPQ